MPCCLFYCHLASQLDPKPLKRVIAFWFSSAKKEYSSQCEFGPPVVLQSQTKKLGHEASSPLPPLTVLIITRHKGQRMMCLSQLELGTSSIRNVKFSKNMSRYTVCVIFLIKLRWPKNYG